MDRLIAVCVATYRRPEMLAVLLHSLTRMKVPEGWRVEVRVVDNDAERTAEPVFLAWERASPGFVRYDVEPRNSISLARNRCVDMGPADRVMFIDDDEVADRSCLVELVGALERTGADVALGFVGGRLPAGAPGWMRRGGFFDHPTGPVDEPVDWRGTRAGCTLVRGRWFYSRGLRFDPAFGRSGSEDVDLFARMADDGGVFVSSPRAVAWEHIPDDRATLRSLLRRSYRNGVNYHVLCQRRGLGRHPLVQLAGRLVKCSVQAVLSVPAVLAGRPECLVRAVLRGALTAGGLSAWRHPGAARQLVAYGDSPLEPAHAALDVAKP